jgi:hypothetical protein
MSKSSKVSLYFVRHGQRIDNVDPNWKLSSPYPEDPPITTHGQHQARQTGMIIRDFALEGNLTSLPSFSSSTVNNKFLSFSPSSNILLTPPNSSPGSSIESSPTKSTLTHTYMSEQHFNHHYNNNQQNHQNHSTRDFNIKDTTTDNTVENQQPLLNSNNKDQNTTITNKKHHFAIVTSPFLRCTQTAIELAKGIRDVKFQMNKNENCDDNELNYPNNKNNGSNSNNNNLKNDDFLVTIAIEAGISGKSCAINHNIYE